ncbi:MAG: dihydrofolate reductase [Sphingobacteriales bacterium]|nr:MAG: dihydrofolate reductase [Sphingobacteriales bacterium]TAF81155.1 MAG: dihydrofolate reductase [Sphingobacteriales bacterium]
MKITIIVATDQHNGIGANNQLMWYLPADLKFFKQTTTGHTIIMGRKTYDSIGKPLPNRQNMVVSRQKNLKIAGVQVFNAMADALTACKNEEEVFIIGGAEMYKLALPFANKIYLTKVNGIFNADVYFPEIVAQVWKETSQIFYPKDDKNAFDFTLITLDRI